METECYAEGTAFEEVLGNRFQVKILAVMLGDHT